MMYDDLLKLSHIETTLRQKAAEWVGNPQPEGSYRSYNSVPFEEIEGFRARATLEHGVWLFKAIVRRGYSGIPCKTLAESLLMALEENEEWLFEYRKSIEKRINRE